MEGVEDIYLTDSEINIILAGVNPQILMDFVNYQGNLTNQGFEGPTIRETAKWFVSRGATAQVEVSPYARWPWKIIAYIKAMHLKRQLST